MNKKNMIIIILILLTVSVLFLFYRESSFLKKNEIIKAGNYIQSREYEKAEKVFLSIIKDKKNDNYTEAIQQLGRLYYFQQRYGEAKELFEKLSKITQNQNELLIYLILIAEKQGNCDLALEYIAKFQEINSDNISNFGSFGENISLVLSRCYLSKGEIEKAKYSLKKSLETKDLDEFYKTKIILQEGKNFLELADYKEARNYFKKDELSKSLTKTEKIELNHLLSMTLLGEQNYSAISKMSEMQDFFQGSRDSLIFAFFSSGMADIKQNRIKEGRENMNKIFNIVIKNLDMKEFYNFYYYSFLRYYGLGKADIIEKKYENAENNFKKIIEISEKIPASRYESFIEKNNLIFLRLLAHYELALINHDIKNDFEKSKQEINNALDIINELTENEKRIISLKEIGNEGSIVEKINNFNLKPNEEN
jgi:tetratricopeptide (TPR) repeat protein